MRLFIITIVLLLNTIIAQAQINKYGLLRIVEESVEKNRFSGVVLVAEQGEPIFKAAFGQADRETKREITVDDPFRIASVTKAITSIVVMQLIQEGTLTIDSSIEEILPKLEIPNASNISVHHLLLHTSGLKNEREEYFLSENSAEEMVLESVYSGQKISEGLDDFNYNNIDYLVLQLMIEKIEGKDWKEVMTERIITPLDLENTGFLSKNDKPEAMPKGYLMSRRGKYNPEPDFHIENFGAAGAMYSTVMDLLKIDQALYTEEILSSEYKELMNTSYSKIGYVAYGNWVYNYPFEESMPKLVERRGGILGFNLVTVRFIEQNKTLIILSNNNAFNPDSFNDEKNLKERLIKEIAKG
ncbi:MAG: hypothetical protein BalsKO_19810 [Balneolaceae bacterium]